jgi:hypothetical protein
MGRTLVFGLELGFELADSLPNGHLGDVRNHLPRDLFDSLERQLDDPLGNAVHILLRQGTGSWLVIFRFFRLFGGLGLVIERPRRATGLR